MTKYPKSKEKGIINMKKIIVIILGFSLFCSLALLTQAAVITPDTGYTVYPILKNENVRFYEENGDEILVPDEPGNGATYGTAAQLQTWWQSPSHLAQFDFGGVTMSQGVAVLDSMVTEITFTGTAIKIGTCYRNGGNIKQAARVFVDGEEKTIDNTILNPASENETTPTVWFEISGLKDIRHTVRIISDGGATRLSFDWYSVIPGTGADSAQQPEESSPPTADAVIPAVLLTALSAGGVVLLKKKRA